MEKGDGKPWERPWSTDEIREHSANWNLAGDSGLLHHLQQFSEKLLTRTHETEVSVNQLMEDMKTSSTEIQNVMNTFLALANTQFVENRVYDDDEKETPPEEKKEEEKVKTKEEHEAEVVEKVKEALQVGMAVLDTHFDAVEVPASDSEEEESSASVGRLVLKPRNMYATRPLPYIIGSQEFMEDDKVGLGDMSSDTEESPDQNIIQSSESDEDIEHDDAPIMAKRAKMASSSDTENSEPESDRGGSIVRQKPYHIASAMDAQEEEGDMFGQESPPEADVLPNTRGSLPSAFTDELSAKLGGEKREAVAPRPKKDSDNMFLPPSEPEEENSLFGHSSASFSGGRGLFDDLDDWSATSNSLWKADEDSPQKVPGKLPKGKEVKQSQSAEKKLFGYNEQVQNLFDDSQQDDLFSTSNPNPPSAASEVVSRERKASMQEASEPTSREGSIFSKTGKTSENQISVSPSSFGRDDAEDDLFSASTVSSSSQDTSKRKKLAGAVPVFSDVNLFGNKPPSLGNRKTSESSDDVKKPLKITAEPSSKPLDAASSSSDVVHTEKKISKENENIPGDDLFNSSSVSAKKKAPSLFGEDEEDESGGLFSKPKITVGHNKNVSSTKPAMPASLGTKPKKAISLFDDSDSGDDELLFSSTSSTSSRSRRSQASGDVLAVPVAPVERKLLPKKGLDDLFFGISTQEEPDFDIFNTKQSAKAKPSSIAEEVDGSSSVGVGATLGGMRVSSGLFDDIDEVDDIFAITKKPPVTIPTSTNDNLKPQNRLFSDNVDETDDIFSSKRLFPASAGADAGKSVPKVDSNLTSEKESEDIFSSKPLIIQKDLHSHAISAPPTTVPSLDNKTLFDNEEDIFSSKDLAPPVEGTAKVSTVKSVNNQETNDSFSAKSLVSDEKESTSEAEPPSLLENKFAPKAVDIAGSRDPKNKPLVSQKPAIGKKPGSLPPPTAKPLLKPIVPERSETKQVKTDNMSQTSTEKSSEIGSSTKKVVSDPSRSAEEPTVPSSKPEPPRTLNIRKTTEVLFGSPSNENDLFGSSWSETCGEDEVNKVNAQKPLKGAISSAVSSNSFGALLKDYESAVEKASTYVRESPKRENPVRKISGSLEDDPEAGSTERLPSKISKLSPGKLTIDPTALLPGAKHPGHARTPETGVGFDKPVETSGMLHSAGKERVKIQVKRRPQSRRARQEALRASFVDNENLDAALISQVSDNTNETNTNLLPDSDEPASSVKDQKDDQVLTDTEDSQVTASDDLFESTSARSKQTNYLEANSNPLSPSTDEEDLFAVPQELPYDEASSKDQPQDYKDMFGGAPVLSPVDSKPEIGSLFEPTKQTNPPIERNEKADKQFEANVVEKDDLCGSVDSSGKGTTASLPQETESSEIVPRNIFSKSSNMGSSTLSKDISNVSSGKLNFDDSDDDDDLFSSMKRSKEDKIKVRDKRSFLADDFTPFPVESTDVLDIQKSATKRKDFFSPREEDIDSLFMNKNLQDSHTNKSSDFLSLGAADRDNQKIPDILGGGLVSDSFLSKKIIETDVQTKSQTDSLFGETFGDSDDLFGSAVSGPKKAAPSSSASKSASKLKGSSLFEDTGEDDDIFSSSSIKSGKLKVKETLQASSENLFSESAADDDTDLFSSRPSSSKSQKIKQYSVQKKHPTEDIFEDPLMVVKK